MPSCHDRARKPRVTRKTATAARERRAGSRRIPTREDDMKISIACNRRSLRDAAEKWFTAGRDTTLHVLLHGRTRRGGHRYVWVEARRPASAHALFFFWHDGGWRVLPPDTRQPMANAALIA
jgi:hypothetical protein